MDAVDGKGHIAEGEDEMTIAMDANDIAFNSTETAAGDTYTLPLSGIFCHGVGHELEVPGHGLVNTDEFFHLTGGYLRWTFCSMVFDQISPEIYVGKGCAEKTERSVDK